MNINDIINNFLIGLAKELEQKISNNSEYNKGVQDCINYLLSQKKYEAQKDN